MLLNIALGATLVVVTTALHAVATAVSIRALSIDRLAHWELVSRARVVLIATLVLFMFFVAFVEVSVWAFTFVALGALPEFETALYFSMVTFTTLGYGDVLLPAAWRLLGSFEAANGTMMFGWTTALIVAFVHHLYLRVSEAKQAD